MHLVIQSLQLAIGAVVLLPVLARSAGADDSSPDPSRVTSGLLARWSFDAEAVGARLPDDSGSALDATATPSPMRVRGVLGSAISLEGAHAVRLERFPVIPSGLPAGPADLGEISLAVWARPSSLSGFRELFRQESGHRVLFSFQESGTILSLGLDIGGYLECDARIEPARVLDGAWHHCAATFDGRAMRVYLDGEEVGQLEHPGRIALDPTVPAFIGSLGGAAEHFQGELDELEIHAVALSPGQVRTLWRQGSEALAARDRELEPLVRALYAASPGFAETLANTRQRLRGATTPVEPEVARATFRQLATDFPAECRDFQRWTGLSPAEFLASKDPALAPQLAGRCLELLLEYRPLTEQQRGRQSEADRQRWVEAEAFKARQDALLAQGEADGYASAWIRLILDVGPRIQWRPATHEPVAPYVRPATPVTRDLTAAEARQALEHDWLHQASGRPTRERIIEEIRWTHELIARIEGGRAADASVATRRAGLEGERSELAELERRAASATAQDRELYLQVRDLKRRVMFRNPVLDFDRVLMVDMPFPQGSEWQHETRHRLGYMAVPGGRLLVLDGLGPHGHLTQLMPQAPLHGSFWRPDLSFDGTKALVSFKPHNEKSFHLYEINLDGSGLAQLTDGPYDDLDPIYLPDGEHLLFSTTRGHTYVRCMPPTSAFVLARCDADGHNIYLISANNEPDYLPSLLDDGRVIYTRWEYTDKPLWRAQKLWTVRPDGTQVNTLWGNQSVWPDVVKDARAIPGSRRIMMTGSAHHNWFSGAVGIIDPAAGFNFPHGLTKVTAELPWPECGNGPVDPVESPRYHTSGRYEAYYSPYPLSETDFLVSAQREGKFVLYLMDVEGNRELVYEGTHHLFHALPVRPRPRPPAPADLVKWPAKGSMITPAGGVLFSGNVYEGAPEALRGQAKFLRVLSIDHKTYTYWYKRPYISTGPVVSAVQSEGVKRLLGTVPIEPDGSVSFEAPAGIPLHFQLLDAQQRALQTMRSFVSVMPGESRGCLGCHEAHSRSPGTYPGALALKAPPRNITPPPWDDHTVSYPRYVRPVLDRYCRRCHEGDGEGRKTLDLTERPSAPIFTEPYLTLIGRPTWGTPYHRPEKPAPGFGIAGTLMIEGYGTTDPEAYTTPPPMTALSYRSPLIELVTSGTHHDVKVDEESRLRLITWIDAMCPFLGDEEIREIPDPEFQGVDWLAVRPKVASAPRISRPGPVD